jgi:hypothetical protein
MTKNAKLSSNERVALAAILARTNLGKNPPHSNEVQKLLEVKNLTIESAVSNVFHDLIKSDEHFETFVEEGKNFLAIILKKSHTSIENEYPKEYSLVFSRVPDEVSAPATQATQVKEETKMDAAKVQTSAATADPKEVQELRSELGLTEKKRRKMNIVYPEGSSRAEKVATLIKGLREHAAKNLDKGENWDIIQKINDDEAAYLIGPGRTIGTVIAGIQVKLQTMDLQTIRTGAANELAERRSAQETSAQKKTESGERPNVMPLQGTGAAQDPPGFLK